MHGSVQALWRALGLNVFLFFIGAVSGLFDLADDDVLSARDAPLSVGAIVIITAIGLIGLTVLAWILMRTTRRPGKLFGRLLLVLAGLFFALLLKLHHVPMGGRIVLGLMIAAGLWAAWGWIRPAAKRRRARGSSLAEPATSPDNDPFNEE